MLKPEQVAALLTEARSWVGTPYHEKGRVKGGGTDCVQLLAGVAINAGILDEVQIRNSYSVVVPEGSEYIDRLLQYADEITEADVTPGCIALYKTSFGFMHSAIVVSWPDAVIHATNKRGVIIGHGKEDILRDKEVRFFCLKG